jgi:thiamine biosynthesis lipoprotein
VTAPRFARRARPALGTLVELGVRIPDRLDEPAAAAWTAAAFAAGWSALAAAERALSAFDPESDVGRFNAAPAGAVVPVSRATARVLRAAAALARESGGLFDVTQGTAPAGWALEEHGGGARLRKRTAEVRLDLGGIAKGYAVDRAFSALAAGVGRGGACWVNAGGDLRVHGVSVPVHLRDERRGGARPWIALHAGALATSRFGPGARSRLAGGAPGVERHVSVASPRCLWSDALTKVVALSGQIDHPALARRGATAWLHREGEA